MASVQLREWEGRVSSCAVRLEQARPVTGLRLVEARRRFASTSSLGLFVSIVGQQLERVAQRGFRRGRVIGLGLVTLPLLGDRLGRFAIRATRAATDASIADAEIGVPDSILAQWKPLWSRDPA